LQQVAYKIEEIEGIGPAYGEKLAAGGIGTTDDLLNLCADAKGRKSTAEKTGLSESQLLKWANMADLMRISGVGSEYSELLEAAGVDTVKELRNRNAANLATKMDEVNADKKLTRTVPNEAVVQRWVDQAKELDPLITH
jgi:predicted flap endonuclease-1-like 5' DNA nuclease